MTARGTSTVRYESRFVAQLTGSSQQPKLVGMEVNLNSELQAKVTDLAAKLGQGTDQVIADALSQYVDEQTRFFQAVEEGIAAAERGEFIEHKEVWANVERILNS